MVGSLSKSMTQIFLADDFEDASKLRTAFNRAHYVRRFKPCESSSLGSRSSVATGSTGRQYPSVSAFSEPQGRSNKGAFECQCTEQKSLEKPTVYVIPVTSQDTTLRNVNIDLVKLCPEQRIIQRRHSLPQQMIKLSRV